MSLSLGIVGLPNVGKSTLFTALTSKQVEVANYPFATIDPNVGVVEVPDERLVQLAEMSRSQKTIPSIVEFTDIAGLVKGASEGVGLGNKFLSHISEVDAILYVIRAFESKDIQHIEESVDPVRDSDIVRSELALKDIETIDKRIYNLTKELKRSSKDKELQQEQEVLQEWLECLNSDVHIYQHLKKSTHNTQDISRILKKVHLLTAKPVLYVVNAHADIADSLKQYIQGLGCGYIVLDAQAELEGAQMTQQERQEIGLEKSALPTLIQESYKVLNLISFFTTGEKESRAWTVKKGSTAPVAGGVIHSDFEDFFIRAEVIQWQTLLKVGSWSDAKKQGLVRTQGKEYVVQDGDVMIFLYNQT